MKLPVITLVGRPNVGKSTLFNHLLKSRQALVSSFAGLTHDRQYAKIVLDKNNICTIVDTGGLSAENNSIDNAIYKQILIALHEADIIYFMVSAENGVTELDFNIGKRLQKFKKNIILVCNKAEKLNIYDQAEFYKLGISETIFIAAKYKQGIASLIAKTLPLLPKSEIKIEDDLSGIIVAILGRPNVGKSTLINCMLKEKRVLSNDQPGTTRDSIYIPFIKNNQKYTLIDTAGIRRKSNVNHKIEKFSIIKAIDALEKAHIAILLVDAKEGVTEQDATLLGMIDNKAKALLIVINKWDGLNNYQKQEVKRKLEIKLAFINYASIHYISALHNLGVSKLFTTINKSYKNANAKFATSLLNKILQKAKDAHQPPLINGVRLKTKYICQSATFPPTFTIHGNNLLKIPKTYERYLKNFFIKELGLNNTPINIVYKEAENPFKHRKNILTNRQINKRKRLLKFNKSKR